MARSTVSDVRRRHNAGKLKFLEVPEPEDRYERNAAGDLIHLDIKTLGRIEGVGHRVHGDRQLQRRWRIGWEYVHVAVDDFGRLGSRRGASQPHTGRVAAGFLRRALCSFRRKWHNGPPRPDGQRLRVPGQGLQESSARPST
jgi:hypothetical protein